MLLEASVSEYCGKWMEKKCKTLLQGCPLSVGSPRKHWVEISGKYGMETTRAGDGGNGKKWKWHWKFCKHRCAFWSSFSSSSSDTSAGTWLQPQLCSSTRTHVLLQLSCTCRYSPALHPWELSYLQQNCPKESTRGNSHTSDPLYSSDLHQTKCFIELCYKTVGYLKAIA